jgi:predicted phosphoribosyltransferase
MLYDRYDAGERLAKELNKYKNNNKVIVIGIPRGGVVVAFEVAKALNTPLDIVVARKISVPGNPEFAIGAVSEKGEIILNENSAETYKIADKYIKKEVEVQRAEVKRRLEEYRGGKDRLILKNKIVILVDDGIATGASIKAAISSVKAEDPQKILLAIPVAPPDTISELKKEVDEVVCLEQPETFFAVGQAYQIFDQTSDEEVKDILESANKILTNNKY